ncbi:hypothetical protein LCGC14_2975090, partial [marine sediment metagenome]
RSDGTFPFDVREGAVELQSFAAIAGWQKVDVVFTATTTGLRFLSFATSAGYVEFDKMSFREVLDQTIDKAKGGLVCLLGDGQGTGKPAFRNPGLFFDGVDDDFTLPPDPTGTFTVAWKRRNEAVVFASDLTTWNLIGAPGGFAGLLDYLAVWNFALSPIQKTDLSLAWQGGRSA